MRRHCWWLFAVVCLIAAGPRDPADADLERNRRLLEKWRADPEHHARLQRDLKAFYALPPERQEALRKIDRQMHEGDLASQTRRWGVLERYSAWRDKLPRAARQQVFDAPDGAARLEVIRRLRAQEWVARLPDKVQKELQKLPLKEREARIGRLRQEERNQRKRWRTGPRTGLDYTGPRPVKLTDFPPEVQAFVKESLWPRLNTPEKEQVLKAGQGKWPELARALLELWEKHPPYPPGPLGKITSQRDLPHPEGRKLLVALGKRRDELNQAPKRWPEFALELNRLMRDAGRRGPPLGASRLNEFPPEVQSVVHSQLYPTLTKAQRASLDKQEGRWPEYPRRLIELAWLKNVYLPGLTLPGARRMWEAARAALPEALGLSRC